MNSMMSAGNNGGGADGGGGERRKEEKKLAARASSRKGCMKGKGGPLNASCTFKGVRQRTWGRWVSEIRDPKARSRVWLGTFNSSREAAMAYDAAARKLFGPNARLNLPDEVPPPPPEPTASERAVTVAAAVADARYHRLLMEMKMKQEYEKQMQIKLYMQMIQQQQVHMEINKQIHGGIFGVVNSATNDHSPSNQPIEKQNFKEAVGENVICFESTFKNLNANLPEFDDSAMWEEAVSTMDYHSQVICDPGIVALTFGDAIGIQLKHPLVV